MAIIPFIILGVAIYLIELSYQNIQERELNEILDLIIFQRQKITSDLDNLLNAVEAYPALPEWRILSSVDEIVENAGGIPELEEQTKRKAAQFLISDFGFQSFGLTLKDGRMYLLEPFEHQKNLSKTNFSDREWFQGVLKNKQTYVSNVFISDASNHPIIVISTPIFSKEGEVIGMWGGSLDIEYLTDFLMKVQKENTHTLLIDENFVEIADTRDFGAHGIVRDEKIIEIMDIESDSPSLIKQNGEFYFKSDFKVANKNWSIITMISENDLIPQLSSQRNNDFILISLMAIFIIISEYLLFNFLRKNFQLNSDIKENRKALLKQERLAAIGELASRVSHDIRNPLSNIRMSIKLIEKETESKISDSTVKEKLEIINKNLNRIEHQINDVLGYVKDKRAKRELIPLNSCFEESITLLHVPENIKIIAEKTNLKILADPVQIHVVCNNILINAIQAIGKQNGQIIIKFSEEPEYIVIKVENSGPPIPEEILPHIFDALVTTKEIGTGLGLASCKRIIENHGGEISVRNNPTTFIIKIPKS